VNALLFGVYGFFMDIQMKNPGDDPTLMQIYLAGTGSGIVNRYLIDRALFFFFSFFQLYKLERPTNTAFSFS